MKEKLKEVARLYIKELVNGRYIITSRHKYDVYATLESTGDNVVFSVYDNGKVDLNSNLLTISLLDNYLKTTKEEESKIFDTYITKIGKVEDELKQKEIRDLETRLNILKSDKQ